MSFNVQLKGFDAFAKYADSIDPNGPQVFFYFSGSKTSTGDSWCPDCVEGSYNEFTKFLENLPTDGSAVYFFFTGKKKENGRSWCISCQIAEPIVQAFLSEVTGPVTFVYVDVGDRDYWKDRACPFRTDRRCKLMVIPTIIKWKGVQRLEGGQCANRNLLHLLMEPED